MAGEPKNMVLEDLMPMILDRETDPLKLEPTSGRVLDHVDPSYFVGRIRRGPGWVRMQPETTTAGQSVLNAAVIASRTCEKFIIDCDEEGQIRLFPSDGSTTCSGPLPGGGALPAGNEDQGETSGAEPGEPGSGYDPDIPT